MTINPRPKEAIATDSASHGMADSEAISQFSNII
jgi:hypothetical protein